MDARVQSDEASPRYVPTQFFPATDWGLILRAQAAGFAVAAAIAATVIVHRAFLLIRDLISGQPGTESSGLLIQALIATVVFLFTVRMGLDYVFFLKEGGYLRLIPEGVQFRDKWFRLHTIPWNDLAKSPRGDRIEIRTADGQTRKLTPRAGHGVVEIIPFCDTLSVYRPDLAIEQAREVLSSIEEQAKIIDLRSASDLSKSVPDAMDFEIRPRRLVAASKPGEKARLSPDGLTIRFPFRWSTDRTFPWSVFSDLMIVQAMPKMPEPFICLWRDAYRPDRMICLPLAGMSDPVRVLATIYQHRPDLDSIRRWESRIETWQARLKP